MEPDINCRRNAIDRRLDVFAPITRCKPAYGRTQTASHRASRPSEPDNGTASRRKAGKGAGAKGRLDEYQDQARRSARSGKKVLLSAMGDRRVERYVG